MIFCLRIAFDNMKNASLCTFEVQIISLVLRKPEDPKIHTLGLGHKPWPVNCTVNIIYLLSFVLHIYITMYQAVGMLSVYIAIAFSSLLLC